MDEIKQCLSIIQQVIATQQTQILKLIEQVDSLQTQVASLNNMNQEKDQEIQNLKVRIEESEQYSWMDNVIFTGLMTKHRSFANG